MCSIKNVTDADKAQGQKRVSAPLTTQERNRTANRILKTVARIAAAGILEFADDPDTLASFEALKRRRKQSGTKKDAKPQGGEPPKPAPQGGEPPKPAPVA